MHYIRFLKQPRLVPAAASTAAKVHAHAPGHARAETNNTTARLPNHALSSLCVSAKLTITTDLGEFFLYETVQLCATLVLEGNDGGDAQVESTTVGKIEVQWTASDGYSGLEITIPLTTTTWRKGDGRTLRMLVQPKEHEYQREEFGHFDNEQEGGVVSVRSMAIEAAEQSRVSPPLAERVFVTGEREIRIWEETGESIARHIWDAGLILSSYIASLSPSASTQQRSSPFPALPLFTSVLQKPALKVLELGAGCGIVGITLSQLYANNTQTTLTDLPEASEILSQNIAQCNLPHLKSCILDWSLPLPPHISSEAWDLVLVADCTYNPDVVPHLVRTLQSVVQQRRECLIVLAMKVRHVSELVFFDLMCERGFVVKERVRIPLLVLGQEDEEVEILSFALGDADAGT
ncbi:upf0665 family protein c [Phlyctema vagabunda]|uniref:Upf0665 family protein c n=1 Tax=Phlyctema vagabunda TaxID=108571 RepID=A0ABR4PBQ5_9HELO